MAGGFPAVLKVGAEVGLARIQKALCTAGEAGWQSHEKIRKRQACPVGNPWNGAGAVTVECESWIGGNVGIRIENRVTVVGAESQLVRSLDPTDVVCGLSFNGIVVAGLHVHSADGKSIRVDPIGESRADTQIHVSFEWHPDVFHPDITEINNRRVDTWIQRSNGCQVNSIHDTAADQVGVAEDQRVCSLIDLTRRAREN